MRSRHAARHALAAIITAVALSLTACHLEQGPAGTVVDRDRTYWSATKQWTYSLTVRKPDGAKTTFRVSRSDYHACGPQAAYPTCTGVS
jgi:hypothetical protein